MPTLEPADTDPASPAPSDSRKPLTIVLGCDTFAPNVNGAARFAERLAAGMIDRGHTVHIVAPADSRRHGEWDETHSGHVMHMHRLYSWRWPWHDWLRFAMPWTIRKNAGRILDEVKPDVIHFQSHFIVGSGLTYEGRKRGIRVIGTNHTMPENLIEFTVIPKFARPFLIRQAWAAARRVFRDADVVTTPTRRAAEFLTENTGITDVHAIGNGVHVSEYTPSFEPRSENRIVFVGRIAPEKALDVLIRAVALLPESLDVQVELIGEGDQRHRGLLERLAVQLGVADRITFAGHLSEDELKDAYTRSTILVMPSTAELQSLATMEAMSSGLPIVGANAMALPHLIRPGENGYLFAPGDARDLAAKLEQIFTLPQAEFDAMKRASLRIIQAHDIERTLDTFESLYRGIPVADPVTDPIATDEPTDAAAR